MIRLIAIITIELLFTCNLFGQAIPNAGFEQPDISSKTGTSYWKAESDDFVCIADAEEPFKGTYSLKVSSQSQGNHFFNQEFPFAAQGLKKYKIKCAFKTKAMNGTLQLGARVYDKDGGTITKTVIKLTENGNQEWTVAEGFFVSDGTPSKLRVYGNLAGIGNAWFDEITVEEMGPPAKGPSVEVALFIHEYFDIVYENSIISDKNYIAGLKAKTMYLCADSIDKNACYSILKYYTTPMLKDGHSFFTTQEEWQQMGAGQHPATGEIHHEFPSGKMLDGNIAYLNIPMFVSSDEKMMHQYADSAQSLIAGFDRKNVSGYIIDLSKNGGGNSLPMIAGIGPLIGNGICGYSFSGDGLVRARIYNEGSVGWDTTVAFHKLNPYELQHANKPIAVIYGYKTGSSGEVTATAFIGLNNSKSFGQATAGATTRIDNFEMSDGSFLNMAAGANADRNKKKHNGAMKPDVETEDTEAAVKEAMKWISESRR